MNRISTSDGAEINGRTEMHARATTPLPRYALSTPLCCISGVVVAARVGDNATLITIELPSHGSRGRQCGGHSQAACHGSRGRQCGAAPVPQRGTPLAPSSAYPGATRLGPDAWAGSHVCADGTRARDMTAAQRGGERMRAHRGRAARVTAFPSPHFTQLSLGRSSRRCLPQVSG